MDLCIGREEHSKFWPFQGPGFYLLQGPLCLLCLYSLRITQEHVNSSARWHHWACDLRQEWACLQESQTPALLHLSAFISYFHSVRHGRHPYSIPAEPASSSYPCPSLADTPHNTAWGVREAAPGQTPQLPIVPTQSLVVFQSINVLWINVCLWPISRTPSGCYCQFCQFYSGFLSGRICWSHLITARSTTLLYLLLALLSQSFTRVFFIFLFWSISKTPNYREYNEHVCPQHSAQEMKHCRYVWGSTFTSPWLCSIFSFANGNHCPKLGIY